jgi:outer membrane murein-binding lipoprotein Lpp
MSPKLRIVFLLCGFAVTPITAILADAPAAHDTVRSLDAEIKALKEAREQARLKGEIAGRDADRFLTIDWLSYRNALQRQEYFQHQVKELDAKIAELEKRKKAATVDGEK